MCMASALAMKLSAKGDKVGVLLEFRPMASKDVWEVPHREGERSKLWPEV